MMDILSFLIFFIYSLVLLLILVYVSPLLSAFIMIMVPIASVFILYDRTINFLFIKQFSFAGGAVPVYNIHLLLLIWSAFIGIIAYAEVLTWYLLKEKKPGKREVTPLEQPKTSWYKLKKFLQNEVFLRFKQTLNRISNIN